MDSVASKGNLGTLILSWNKMLKPFILLWFLLNFITKYRFLFISFQYIFLGVHSIWKLSFLLWMQLDILGIQERAVSLKRWSLLADWWHLVLLYLALCFFLAKDYLTRWVTQTDKFLRATVQVFKKLWFQLEQDIFLTMT